MIYANVAGVELRFETAPSLFSPTKLDPRLGAVSKAKIDDRDQHAENSPSCRIYNQLPWATEVIVHESHYHAWPIAQIRQQVCSQRSRGTATLSCNKKSRDHAQS